MVIPVDMKKTFENNQHTLMKKINIGHKRNIPIRNEGHHHKLTVSIISKGERPKVFPLRLDVR